MPYILRMHCINDEDGKWNTHVVSDCSYRGLCHKMKLMKRTSLFMLLAFVSNWIVKCDAEQPKWGLVSTNTNATRTIPNVESWEVCGMYCNIDAECSFWTWVLPNHPDMFIRMDCQLRTSNGKQQYCTQQPWCEYVSGKSGCYSLYTC